MRYCDPTGQDRNRARWPNHPFWEIACAELNDELFDMRSGVDPAAKKEVHREARISLIMRNIRGCALTVAALKGITYDHLPAHFDDLAHSLSADTKRNPDSAKKALVAAKNKYRFVTRPDDT